ncbi:hypothetical protein GGI12_003398 [Dipsacomyces acuminosporus]|nr:hypothetical protein GGI12_003398 [Dipsacomyces acuminosporus]
MSNTDPNSRFISESAINEARKEREEAWRKAYEAGETSTPAPDNPDYDPRTLYERLQEQRQRKEEAYAESRRFGNQIRKLDVEETEFLDSVGDVARERSLEQKRKDLLELEKFKTQVASKQQQQQQQQQQVPSAQAMNSASKPAKDKRGGPSILSKISNTVVIRHSASAKAKDREEGEGEEENAGCEPVAKRHRAGSNSSSNSSSNSKSADAPNRKPQPPPGSNPLALLSSYASGDSDNDDDDNRSD